MCEAPVSNRICVFNGSLPTQDKAATCAPTISDALARLKAEKMVGAIRFNVSEHKELVIDQLWACPMVQTLIEHAPSWRDALRR